MAINKKEAAAHAAEVEKWRIRAALSWTPEVKPDVSPPKSIAYAKTTGWLVYGTSVDRGWSGSQSHGYGKPVQNDLFSASKGERHLYSSKLLALRALRNRVEDESARKLLGIDKQIEDEEAILRLTTNLE